MSELEFSRASDLAIYIRDEMDRYLGMKLPEKFIDMFNKLMEQPRYKKMVFKGDGYTKVFVAKLRASRIERLQKAIPNLPAYKETD